MRRAFVAGAGGAVGEAIVWHLLRAGWSVIASVRTPRSDVLQRLGGAGASVVRQDIECNGDWIASAEGCEVLVFATHLSLAVRALQCVDRTGRVVAFSSNNVAIDPEADAYRELAQAEQALLARVPQAAIVRPTMIYGDRRLPTVTKLLQLARRSPVLPLPGSGRALVQPVFADDLGALGARLCEALAPGVYAAGGPDIVTMREFFSAIANAVGSSPFIVSTPKPFLDAAARLRFLGFSKAQAKRAERCRIAVEQTQLPAGWGPKTPLPQGLKAHLASMREN